MHQTYKVNTNKCFDTKYDLHITLLEIGSTSLWPGLPSSATLLFNWQIRDIMPRVNRPLIDVNNNDEQYEALVRTQTKNDKNHDTSRNYTLIPIGSTVAVQEEDGVLWTHGSKVGRETITTMTDHTPYCNKDRMADHQEQQACEANTDSSQAIPPGSIGQTHSYRPFKGILKHIEKQTPMNHI